MKKICILIIVLIWFALGMNFLPNASMANLENQRLLDLAFGNGGRVSTDFAGANDEGESAVLQSDGKIVVVGKATESGVQKFGIARYNSDGSLDATFRNAGKFTSAIGTSATATDVSLQADGKIVVTGYARLSISNDDFVVARFNADGTSDTAFGTNGIASADLTGSGNSDLATAAVLQTDGKIVVSGTAALFNTNPLNADFGFARFNTDGSLDTTFDGDGKQIIDFNGRVDEDFALTLQSDGKIIAGGIAEQAAGGASPLALVRLNADGSLDATFDGDGRVVGSNTDLAKGIVVLPNAQILVGGWADNSSNFLATRYNSDGSLDTTFGSGGRVTSSFGGVSRAEDITLQSDGKFILSGNAGSQFGLARYTTNGTLDTSFGTGGKVTTDFGLQSGIFKTLSQPDNKIVVAGFAYPTSNNNEDFALVRYDADGEGPTPTATPTVSPAPTPRAGVLDYSFDADGKSFVEFTSNASANDVKIQPDGKIVVVGTSATSPVTATTNFGVARLNAAGSLDTTFGTGGKTSTDFSGFYDEANSVAIAPDGKIVVAGYSNNGSNSTNGISIALARYNTDGTLDTTFDADGKLIYQPGQVFSDSRAYEVVVQSDGKIVVAAGISNTTFTFAVFRFNTNGSLDTTFGTNGRAANNSTQQSAATSVILQSDGKIVAAGYKSAFPAPPSGTTIVRYNTNGTFDTTFAGTGIALTSIQSAGGRVRLQSDGKILVGGSVSDSAAPRFEMQRYNADGMRDVSFNASVTAPVGTFSFAIQADGKIVAAGGGNDGFHLYRLLSNGNLDGSFGAGGRVITNVATTAAGTGTANSVAIQTDGQIIAAGRGQIANKSVMAIARYYAEPSVLISRAVSDFDGDGKTDYSVFRPAEGTWFVNRSTNSFLSTQFGVSSDKPVAADYDGDGKTDIAVWREGNLSYFYILQSSNNTARIEQFGTMGDNPTVVGDYDGDGNADLAVYRNAASAGGQSCFYYRPSSQTGVNFIAVPWGASGDEAMRGDFDGDGKMDAAVYRASNNTWYIRQSSVSPFGNQLRVEQWGLASDKRIGGDFDGDGETDLAVFRPSSGVWYILQSSNRQTRFQQWGLGTDILTAGDYDGDGKTDFAVWRSGTFYVLKNSTGANSIAQWGQSGDVPTYINNP